MKRANETVTKAEAAAMLGASLRTVERRLKPLPQKRVGSHGPESIYLRADVLKLAAEMGRPVVESPESHPDATSPAAHPAPLDRGNLPQLVALITAAVREASPQLPPGPSTAAPKTVRLSEKLLLSIPEAAALSGIPAARLRADARSGALKTIQSIGRGLGKVRRDDLASYVKKLR